MCASLTNDLLNLNWKLENSYWWSYQTGLFIHRTWKYQVCLNKFSFFSLTIALYWTCKNIVSKFHNCNKITHFHFLQLIVNIPYILKHIRDVPNLSFLHISKYLRSTILNFLLSNSQYKVQEIWSKLNITT